jgi:RNA recognition motif-containing protein
VYGKIKGVHLVKNPATGKLRGYGFIEYHDERSVRKANHFVSFSCSF